jgi:hypothetical protein
MPMRPYHAGGSVSICGAPNFEKVLGEMIALRWMTPQTQDGWAISLGLSNNRFNLKNDRE